MKAMVYERYGAVADLHLVRRPKPKPGQGEVLIEVHAVSVNSWDVELLEGRPLVTRLSAPWRPRHPVLGSDVAGVVTAVGEGVTDLKAGDAVFGDLSGVGWGGFSEYVCAPAERLVRKPGRMSFEEAAAIPQAGALALQGLAYQGGVTRGQRVLINGAGGGVGTFALQLARHAGCEVTAVDRASKLEGLRRLGADAVVDFETTDPTRPERPYDYILDVSMERSVFAWARALAPDGTYAAVGGTLPRLLQLAILGPLFRTRQGKRMGVVILRPGRADLETLVALFEAGTVGPIIDRSYRLEEIPEAMGRLARGEVLGKVVIAVRPAEGETRRRRRRRRPRRLQVVPPPPPAP